MKITIKYRSIGGWSFRYAELLAHATWVPIMNAAVQAYRNVATSSELREIARLRSKAGHDEAQALHNARRKEREKLQGVIDEKDAVLAEQAGVIDEQAALIAELQAQLYKGE